MKLCYVALNAECETAEMDEAVTAFACVMNVTGILSAMSQSEFFYIVLLRKGG
jgi:hypothetical protein